VAERLGHEVVEVYADNASAVPRVATSAPPSTACVRMQPAAGLDIIMAWSVDHLDALRWDLVALPERDSRQSARLSASAGLDNVAPSGRAIFQMMVSSPSLSGR